MALRRQEGRNLRDNCADSMRLDECEETRADKTRWGSWTRRAGRCATWHALKARNAWLHTEEQNTAAEPRNAGGEIKPEVRPDSRVAGASQPGRVHVRLSGWRRPKRTDGVALGCRTPAPGAASVDIGGGSERTSEVKRAEGPSPHTAPPPPPAPHTATVDTHHGAGVKARTYMRSARGEGNFLSMPSSSLRYPLRGLGWGSAGLGTGRKRERLEGEAHSNSWRRRRMMDDRLSQAHPVMGCATLAMGKVQKRPFTASPESHARLRGGRAEPEQEWGGTRRARAKLAGRQTAGRQFRQRRAEGTCTMSVTSHPGTGQGAR
ncbi:hypothetical protein B0H10DRAFT_2195034 [Mycena sp. CBHHK59/15]|nr:hypothetical protein B0H10DRAFT_2195034 [Mycena sp. CBHHK59/15]